MPVAPRTPVGAVGGSRWSRNGSKLRVAGWLKDDDVILKNSAYADSFVTMKLLDGSLKPA